MQVNTIKVKVKQIVGESDPQVSTHKICPELRYPFLEHASDIIQGAKDLQMQSGLWRAPTLRIPAGMVMPSMAVDSMNRRVLESLFPEGITPLPHGIQLRCQDEAVQGHSPFKIISGAPPAGIDSLFFDDAPGRSWYLQAKCHWAYCM